MQVFIKIFKVTFNRYIKIFFKKNKIGDSTVDRLNWNNRNNESLRMCTLPNSVFRFSILFFARKGYVCRKSLRDLITRYRETGMIRKLDNALVEERGVGRNFNPIFFLFLNYFTYIRALLDIRFVNEPYSKNFVIVEILE